MPSLSLPLPSPGSASKISRASGVLRCRGLYKGVIDIIGAVGAVLVTNSGRSRKRVLCRGRPANAQPPVLTRTAAPRLRSTICHRTTENTARLASAPTNWVPSGPPSPDKTNSLAVKKHTNDTVSSEPGSSPKCQVLFSALFITRALYTKRKPAMRKYSAKLFFHGHVFTRFRRKCE